MGLINKKNTSAADGTGICVEECRIENTSRNAVTDKICEFCMAFLGVWAMSALFLTAFEIQMFGGYEEIYLLAVSMLGYGIFYMGSAVFRKRATAAVLGLSIVIMLVWMSELKFSLYGLITQMNIGISFDKVYKPDFFLSYIFAVLALAVFYFLSVYRWQFSAIIAMFPVIFVVFFDRMPSAFSWVLLIGFVLSESIFGGKTGKNRKTQTVTSQKSVFYPMAVAGTVFLVYLAISIVIPQSQYKGNQWLNHLFNLITETFDQTHVEEVKTASGGISGGKLGKSDRLEFLNQKMLTLVTGSEGNIYLKGFIGNCYEDNAWKMFSKDVYSAYADVFEQKAFSINIYNQTAKVLSIIDNDQALIEAFSGSLDNYLKQVSRRHYSVEYEPQADKMYWYMLYGSTYSVSRKSEADGHPINCEKGYIGSEQYICEGLDYDTFRAFVESYNGENANMLAYAAWEKKYRSFVYDMYTQVPETVAQAVSAAKAPVPEIERLDTQADKMAYAAVLQQYFRENYRYTLAPGAVPEGEDFIAHFLDTQTGYCTYFASTGTMLLRLAGIPARYVEGYVANVGESVGSVSEKVQETRKSAVYSMEDSYLQYTTEITDASAHAWVEIYMDGYGWIPVEFTPGYDNTVSASDSGEISYEAVPENGGTQENTGKTWEELQQEALERETLPMKTDYDTIGEYLESNTAKKINFSIVFRIIGKNILRALIFLLKAAAVMSVISVGLYIPAVISEKKKKWMFEIHKEHTPQEDNEQVTAIFAYIDRLCRFLKISYTPDMSCAQYAAKMKAQYAYFEEAGIDHIVYVIEKISFGHGNIGMAEMKRAVSAAKMIHDQSYLQLGKVKRLLYRFIWHLR